MDKLLYQALILVLSLYTVSNQRTYKRACECEYTKNGKCALTLLTQNLAEHLPNEPPKDSKQDLQTVTTLQTEFSRMSTEISQLKSLLSDVQRDLKVSQMDTGSVMSDLQSLQANYGLCSQRGILKEVERKVSSQWNSGTGASSVHVHSQSAWCPDPSNPHESFSEGEEESAVEPASDYEWVQFDLGAAGTPVLGVVTRGRPDFPQWVTSYKLQYADELIEGDEQAGWTVYKDVVGLDMTFAGNSDSNTPQVHMLWQPIHARYIRIWPLTFEKNFCMRADVIGCIDS